MVMHIVSFKNLSLKLRIAGYLLTVYALVLLTLWGINAYMIINNEFSINLFIITQINLWILIIGIILFVKFGRLRRN